jgi:hypothetical protein
MMVDVRTFSSASSAVLKSQQENLSNGKAAVTRCYRGIFFLKRGQNTAVVRMMRTKNRKNK